MKRTAPDIMAKDFDKSVLQEEITCAHCGKPLIMGKSYKERNKATDGCYYLICRECHEKEWPDDAV